MRQSSSAVIMLMLGISIAAGGACRQTSRQAEAPAPDSRGKGKSEPPRSIAALYPAKARVGEPFQVQPDGNSAIAVTGNGFTRSDRVLWDGQPLKTVYGGPTLLTAEVPPSLLEKAKSVVISVKAVDEPGSQELHAAFDLLAPSAGTR